MLDGAWGTLVAAAAAHCGPSICRECVDSTSCIHAIIVIAELVESTSCTCRVGRRMGTLVAAAAAWVDAWPRLAKKPVSELMCQMLAQRAHWILEC